MLASKDFTALDSSVEPVIIRSSATESNFFFAAVKTFDAKLAGLCECEKLSSQFDSKLDPESFGSWNLGALHVSK